VKLKSPYVITVLEGELIRTTRRWMPM